MRANPLHKNLRLANTRAFEIVLLSFGFSPQKLDDFLCCCLCLRGVFVVVVRNVVVRVNEIAEQHAERVTQLANAHRFQHSSVSAKIM
jgi:hypothetical protein